MLHKVGASTEIHLRLWFLGLGVTQIIGGILSFAFQHVRCSFASWRMMFLVMGLITVIVCFATRFYLPDTPMQAKWLSDDENVARFCNTLELTKLGFSTRNSTSGRFWKG
jgi:MFS family permease